MTFLRERDLGPDDLRSMTVHMVNGVPGTRRFGRTPEDDGGYSLVDQFERSREATSHTIEQLLAAQGGADDVQSEQHA